jgi:hypothetical protein
MSGEPQGGIKARRRVPKFEVRYERLPQMAFALRSIPLGEPDFLNHQRRCAIVRRKPEQCAET